MKPFTQVATPHEDILKGKLQMDVFAADLWQVAEGKAPLDYQDRDLFFKKTYKTKGLLNILEVVKSRLQGKSGDSVIQLQTPFGGGKTHTLISLYHKAREWNAKVVVFDGTAHNPKEVRLWEEIERQLTGKIELTKGEISPGKQALINILSENSPVLILIDELLQYATKAAGVKVGDSNLASQTLAFVQELTAAVATVGNALLVLTLPSSILERYDETSERMFQQLQKITGRTEKIYAPVADDEIELVIRTRLFSKVDEKQIKKIVDEFVEYALSEGLISKEESLDYRERFINSYPFKPEVIDVLYKRWGSFPEFQRTRGVLRLLSLVVYSLLDKNIPFIRIADFDLKNEEIKRELIKHIGNEWDSIISQDITSKSAGAKKVDDELGSAYKAYKLGSAVTTAIFMYSFSGKGKMDASVKDIKLSCVYPEFSSNVVDTALSNLKERLFYLSDEGLYFTNQPNLNRIILSKEENVSLDEIEKQEQNIIKNHISRPPKMKTFLYPRLSRDIPDTPELKLIILKAKEPDREFFEKYGESPRIYKNSLIFFCLDDEYKEQFIMFLRKTLALKSIEAETKLNLTEGQKKEIKNKLRAQKDREYETLRKLYRKIFLPSKQGFKEIDLGLPSYVENMLDKEIYESLRSKGEILEKIAPMVIKNKYLADKKYLEAKVLYEAFLKTPGEIRLTSKDAFIKSIKEGVKNKLFGYGYLQNGDVECKFIGEEPQVELNEGEIIINPELCVKQPQEKEDKKQPLFKPEHTPKTPEPPQIHEPPAEYAKDALSTLNLTLNVPIGQISTIAGVVNYLKTRFDELNVKITISASSGKLKITEYEDKIIEALKQGNIEIEDEEKG